jgi:hypothetical protein
MTYKSNFVCALKVGGKILREVGNQVELPFGSEYSVLLKNLHSVRAQAQITIDGTVATTWLILQPNSTLEIERFLRSDNLDRGNRFKFIERTEAVERGRGVKLEDGLIRIEFKKEKVYEAPKVTEHHTYYHHHYDPWYPYHPYRSYYGRPWITWTGSQSVSGSSVGTGPIVAMNNVSLTRSSASPIRVNMMKSVSSSQQMLMKDMNDAGITVPGSESNQKFVTVSDFSTEQSEVITLKLVGYRGKMKVEKPRTVDVKPRCSTCQKVNKPTAKFCVECGTSLEII